MVLFDCIILNLSMQINFTGNYYVTLVIGNFCMILFLSSDHTWSQMASMHFVRYYFCDHDSLTWALCLRELLESITEASWLCHARCSIRTLHLLDILNFWTWLCLDNNLTIGMFAFMQLFYFLRGFLFLTYYFHWTISACKLNHLFSIAI
jgi:hypothetical protein